MQHNNGNVYRRPAVTPVIQALLIINGLLYVVRQLNILPLDLWFALWPLEAPYPGGQTFKPWQLLTYGFLHGSNMHILFNMFMLWMFGSALERLWGSGPFLRFYLVCVIGAGLVQTAVTALGPLVGATVGASGGVLGLLMGFGMMYPNRVILLIFPPIPMKAKYFVVLMGILELYLGVTATRPTIAHFAHVGGMFFGFMMILYWRGKLPWKPRRTLSR